MQGIAQLIPHLSVILHRLPEGHSGRGSTGPDALEAAKYTGGRDAKDRVTGYTSENLNLLENL